MDSLCRVRNRIMCVLSWRTVSALIRMLILCEINTKITLSWAPKQFVTQVHRLFYIYCCTVLWCAQIIECIVHITLSHYHNYADLSEDTEFLKCLSCIFCVECMSKIKLILSIMFHAIHGAVRFQPIHFSWWLREYMYFILSSWNWKYDPFAIV